MILNACKTAGAAANGLWSVTTPLQARVPAAIGLRANVSGEHARVFSGALYQALAQGKTLDEAMTQARRALWKGVRTPSNAWNGQRHLEVRMDPGGRSSRWAATSIARSVSRCNKQRSEQGACSLVDRRPECSGAWRRVAEDQKEVVVVRGNPGVGKTHIRGPVDGAPPAPRRHQIRYIDLKGISICN